jgi:hypothetical protein
MRLRGGFVVCYGQRRIESREIKYYYNSLEKASTVSQTHESNYKNKIKEQTFCYVNFACDYEDNFLFVVRNEAKGTVKVCFTINALIKMFSYRKKYEKKKIYRKGY